MLRDSEIMSYKYNVPAVFVPNAPYFQKWIRANNSSKIHIHTNALTHTHLYFFLFIFIYYYFLYIKYEA
jgi:hypothetical protein